MNELKKRGTERERAREQVSDKTEEKWKGKKGRKKVR